MEPNNKMNSTSKFFKNMASSKIFQSTKSFIKVHKIWSIVIAVAIIAAGYFGFSKISSSGSTIQYTFQRVTRGNLVISVAGSGQVSTLSQVDIKPNTTGQTQTLGQITSVEVKNGDYVKAGQVVAILDGKNALQALNQAQSSVMSSQASYDKLTGGLTDAQLFSLNNSLTSAQTTLSNAKQNILIQLQSAYTSVTNDVYLNTDSFFTNPTTANPTINIDGVNFTNQQYQNNVNQGRYNIQAILSAWDNTIQEQENMIAASTTDDYIIGSINQTISDLNTVRNYFDDMTTLFSLYSVSSDSSGQSSINSDKGTASSARGNIDSLISSLTSTLQSYNNNITQLQQDQENFSIQQEPPSADDVAVAKASLDNAEANLTTAQQAYDSRIITAPFDGQIGGLNASVGQEVSSSDSLGTLITSQKVINVTLNEIDAAKVSAGDAVAITFDALPNVSMTGKVSYIDPLGTVSQGVVSYAVQISMDTQNSQIETGMTAEVTITTTEHDNTLIIPTSAIQTSGGKKYVLIANIPMINGTSSASTTRSFATSSYNFASTTRASSSRQFGSSSASRTLSSASITTQYPVVKVQITTGISNDTTTEVLTGITAGQLVVTKTTTVKSSTTATKSAATSATTRVSGGAGGFTGGGGFGGGAAMISGGAGGGSYGGARGL
jgi:multidrug efflux pump subunit AcrA (membrane-fusion protein)